MSVESPRGREDQREGVVFYGSQNAAAGGREAVRRRQVPSCIKNAASPVGRRRGYQSTSAIDINTFHGRLVALARGVCCYC